MDWVVAAVASATHHWGETRQARAVVGAVLGGEAVACHKKICG